MLKGKTLGTRRVGAAATIAVAFVVLSASLALAHRAAGYGEMVDYPLVFPVGGPVSIRDTFTAARSSGDHHAQDLMAPKMTPVLAVAPGTVGYVNFSSSPEDLNPDRCCSLTIRHDDGWESWYLHLNNDTPGTDDGAAWGVAEGIVPGARVAAGQQIGWVGDSGNAESTAPHLHFELFDPGGVLVNPYDALLGACGGLCTELAAAATSQAAETAPTMAGPDDTLTLGSVGGVVSDLQATLASLGFDPGPADGIFGRLTMTAVEAFQSARGLTVDGSVGPATKGALGSAPPSSEATSSGSETSASESANPAPAVASAISDSNVVELQMMLAKLGHEPGPIDGAFGPLTFGAVVRFQAAAGLSGSGTVDQGTWDSLVLAAGGSAVAAPTTVVAYGTSGSTVVDLQVILDALGHSPGPMDGIFGPMTANAVIRFQAASGLSAGGVVDQATWDALHAGQSG